VTDAAAMAEMAHHWRAGDVEAGLAASFQAARAAMTSCAYAEAHFQFEQVIDLWPRVSNAPDVLYVTYVDLLCDTAEAANFRGEHDRAIHLMRSALDQIEPSASTRASLLYGRLGHYLWESGDLQQAFAMAEQAASIAPVAPPSAARARALTMLARTRLLTGRLTDGRALAAQGLQIASDVGADRDESTAHQVLGLILVVLGEPEAGIRHLEEATRLAIDLDHVEEIAASSVTLSEALTTHGRLRSAEDRLRAAVSLARERGFERSYGLWLKANLASVLYKLGAWDEAERLAREVTDPRHAATRVASQLAHLVLGQLHVGRGAFESARTHLDAAQETAARQWIDHVPAALAELEIWTDHPERAQEIVARGLEAASHGNEARSDASMLCWLGVRAEADLAEPARPLSDDDALDEAFTTSARLLERSRAIAMHGAAGDRIVYPGVAAVATIAEAEHSRVHGSSDPELWALAAKQVEALDQPFLHAYARWREADACLSGQADRNRAETALLTAHRITLSLGAVPLADAVERLARYARIELSEDTPSSDDRPKQASPSEQLGLTPREVDVLALVAQGKTNAQIGEILFISDKTASVHVSHILAKLGASNRVEAASIAHKLELVDPAR
jgi:ATP/maltotriose-dependent transcriptional regulator MalT